MTVAEFVLRAHEQFRQLSVPDPLGESLRLLDVVTSGGIRRLRIPSELNDLDLRRIGQARAGGIPLEYALGHGTFMGRQFRCGPGALIPREETELLAGTAIERGRALEAEEPVVLDIGTGCGNLAITLAHELSIARVYASDITNDALELARTNAAEHRMDDRLSLHQGDVFGAFEGLDLEGRVDLIVCNPPYIPRSSLEKMPVEIREHEPREAFDGGSFGVDIFRRLIRGSIEHLRPGGALVFEIGAGQERLVRRFLEGNDAFTDVRGHADAEGTIRVFSVLRAVGGSASE